MSRRHKAEKRGPAGRLVRLICAGDGTHLRTPLCSISDRRLQNRRAQDFPGDVFEPLWEDTSVTLQDPAWVAATGGHELEVGEVRRVPDPHGGTGVTHSVRCPKCEPPAGSHVFRGEDLPGFVDRVYAEQERRGKPMRAAGIVVVDVSLLSR